MEREPQTVNMGQSLFSTIDGEAWRDVTGIGDVVREKERKCGAGVRAAQTDNLCYSALRRAKGEGARTTNSI